MIGERAIEQMKQGAVLVNTARGGLVDYAALHQALAGGRLRGAGLDVFDAEPAAAAHPLFQLSNVIVTPHVAWLTAETLGSGPCFAKTVAGCATERPFSIELDRLRVRNRRHARLFGVTRTPTHTHYVAVGTI